MTTNPFATQVSADLSMGTDDLGVPVTLKLKDGTIQGDRLPDGAVVFQFYTGNGFQHYVATLSFEDWGGERCPRFAVYAYAGHARGAYLWELCQDVASDLTWPGEVSA